jgi:polysaccharide export outer membrane protein
MLPGSGPREPTIREFATAASRNESPTLGYDYVMVDLTRATLPLLTQDRREEFRTFGAAAQAAPSLRLGPGDVIRVTVFESQTGGLFLPEDAGARPGNFVQLPPQRVDQDGRITVPFAGVIVAQGQTPAALESIIRDRLVDRAIEPEVSVEILEQNFSRFSMIGRVGASGVYPLREGGVRLLEAIAAAGGISTDASSAFVSLTRGGQSAKVSYRVILDTPRENIFLAPGDVVEIVEEERQFFAFGATGLVGRFAFGSEEVTLNEAVARVASLQDNQADPRNVVIYRKESRHALERMGVDFSDTPFIGEEVPTIFRANFRSPDIFFLANEFQMRDGDVIFVTNAATVEFQRFFNNATVLTGGPLSVRDNIEAF